MPQKSANISTRRAKNTRNTRGTRASAERARGETAMTVTAEALSAGAAMGRRGGTANGRGGRQIARIEIGIEIETETEVAARGFGKIGKVSVVRLDPGGKRVTKRVKR